MGGKHFPTYKFPIADKMFPGHFLLDVRSFQRQRLRFGYNKPKGSYDSEWNSWFL